MLRRKAVLAFAIGLGLGNACSSEPPHPVASGTLAADEMITSVPMSGGTKRVERLAVDGVKELDWGLALNAADGGTGGGGEQLFTLDDGRYVYCGMVFSPKMTSGCWLISDSTSERLGPPFESASPDLADFASSARGIARNGAWWKLRASEQLHFSPALAADAEAIAVPFEPPYRRTDYAPATDRFALIHGDTTCRVDVFERDAPLAIEGHAVESCFATIMWTPDGQSLLIEESDALTVWTPGQKPRELTTRATAPDGRPERLQLMAVSPDGARALVRSSRHRNSEHNPCADVYNPVFDTYSIDLKSRAWKRLPDVSGPAAWTWAASR